MKINDIPVVLHTMDSYSMYWDTWYFLFKKHHKTHGPIYFLSEDKEPSFIKDVIHIKTGNGEWGERLISGLKNVNCKYLFYMQEDFWATEEFNLDYDIVELFENYNMSQLYIRDMKTINSLISTTLVEGNLHKFNQHSDYTHSHQFGLWKKDKLIENIKPNENPWKNEINGTIRLNKNKHNVYIIDYDWYVTSVRNGKLMDRGKKVLKKFKLKL